MSYITTYPNSFNTDSNKIDSELLYNFNISMSLTVSTDDVLPGSFHAGLSVPNPASNLKFNNIIYAFEGLYITLNKDVIDKNTTDKYTLLIKCVSYTLDKYLYISLPIASSNDSTELNTMVGSTTYVMPDLNQLIPINEQFYSYKTTGLQTDTVAEVILYNRSDLKMKDIGLSETVNTRTDSIIPLTESVNPAIKVSHISENTSGNDIYIDCQPVDETQTKSVVTIVSSTAKIYNFVETLLPFIIIFGLLYMVLYYKGQSQLSHV